MENSNISQDKNKPKFLDNKYRTIIKQAADAIIIGNKQGILIDANKKMCDLTGYDKKELIGKHISDLFFETSLKNNPINFELVNQGIPILTERELVRKDKTNLYIEMHSSKINNEYVSIIRDISEKKKTIIALKESENKFKSLTETTTAAIFIFRENFLYTNKAFENITGYSSEESIKIKFWSIVHSDHLELVKTRGNRRIKGEDIINNYEFKLITKSGNTKWVDLAVKRIIYKGQPAAIATAIDITQRKEIEEINTLTNLKLKESEFKFRQYIEQNTAAMMAIESDTKKIIFSNSAATKLYGYTTEEFLNMKICEIHTISEDEVTKIMNLALTNTSTEFQFKHLTKEKTIIDVIINASPVVINNTTNMVITIRNITEDLKTKNDLQNSHDSYRNIMDSISEMIYIQNKDGEFLFVNNASVNKYGYEIKDFIGKTPDFLSAPGKNNIEEVITKAQSAYNGSIEHFEFWGIKKNKEIFPKEVILSPGYFFGEKVVIAVSRDVTHQKRIINELISAKDKAEESDRLKSAFLANMSHEVRTPMNAISGFSELLKDPSLNDDEKTEYYNAIKLSSNHLLNLINDLIDISKLQAQKMMIKKTSFSLNELILEMINDFQDEIINLEKETDVHLNYSFGLQDFKDTIYTDLKRLKQILRHTVDNAVKFTNTGKVSVSYVIDNDFIQFDISDEGIGIAKDQQTLIFDQFSQAGSGINREFGGTGLGLNISKACTDLLGGYIRCTSEENVGTKITFTIPYEAV